MQNEALVDYDVMDDELDDAAEDDGMDSLDVDGMDELHAIDEGDQLEEAGEDDGFDALDELAAADAVGDEFEDALIDGGDAIDEDAYSDGYDLDEASGLYLPATPRLISGPAASAIVQRLNPFVLDSLDADEADGFLRRVRRAVRSVGRGVRQAAGRVGRAALRAGRLAAPLLQRALPMIQRVAGLAGPWGRLVSAGIGAARGLASGRGLRGALAGAVGGLVPGIGGRIASAVLRGDGADDDAALDALADMADAGQVAPAIALPLGAGLAARVGTPRPASGWPPALRRQLMRTERTMLQAAQAAGGSAGRRLRILRSIARLVRGTMRQRPAAAGIRAMPAIARTAARQVLNRTQRNPAAGASSRPAAQRRLAQRRRLLNRVPIGVMARAA